LWTLSCNFVDTKKNVCGGVCGRECFREGFWELICKICVVFVKNLDVSVGKIALTGHDCNDDRAKILRKIFA